jgi:hypothetical protein
MVSVKCKTWKKNDGPFSEECQITICENSQLCIELGEQAVVVALQNDSRLGFYRYERHGRLPVETVQVHDHEAHFLRRQASKRQAKPTRQSARLAFRALKALRGAAPK